MLLVVNTQASNDRVPYQCSRCDRRALGNWRLVRLLDQLPGRPPARQTDVGEQHPEGVVLMHIEGPCMSAPLPASDFKRDGRVCRALDCAHNAWFGARASITYSFAAWLVTIGT